MLGDRGYYRNIILCVARIQQRIESPGPGGDLAGEGQHGQADANNPDNSDDQTLEEKSKVILGHVCSEIVNKGVDLTESEHSQCQHVLRGLDRLEPNE